MSKTADIIKAVEHALRAPSILNTQPWRWRIRPDSVELHADWNRHLIATDPDRRDLIISCGAALHHLQVALAAAGLVADVDRLPDPEDRGHLATVAIRTGPVDLADAAQFPAIDRRRTDRRRLSHRPVPAAQVRALAEQARRMGALLLPVPTADRRRRLAEVLTDAAQRQEFAPGYAAELQQWTRRYPAGRDGVAATSVAAPLTGLLPNPSPLHRFKRGKLAQPRQLTGHGPADDAAELLVIATQHDTPLDWLRAGQATSAVLLAATGLGLATTPLSQALEVEQTRRAIQQDVLHAPEHPQLIIRVGWPATAAAELPHTDRRDLRSVLMPI